MSETKNDVPKLNGLLCLNRLPIDDAIILRHQLIMGDVRILPEDIGRVGSELNWGTSLSSLKGSGLIK